MSSTQTDHIEKTEARIQAECFEWFNNTYPHLRGLLYHVPNGEKRSIQTAGKLKAMGVVAGIPDMPFHFNARTYFFEFKKPKTGKASDKQKAIHDQLDLQRFQVWMPEDLKTFQHLIEGIINDKSEQFAFGLSKEDYYYRHKIFDYLYGLSDMDIINVDDICEPENKAKFMHFSIEFITEKYGREEGFEILFKSDYSGLYKQKINDDVFER